MLDADIRSFFDSVDHEWLLRMVAHRVADPRIQRLIRQWLRAGILERAKEVTRNGRFTYIEYARFADDLVVLVDGFRKWEWLLKASYKRLVEEFEKLDVQMNRKKTRIVDLSRDETFSLLGFDYRRVKTRRGAWGVRVTPRMKARTALLRELKDVFRRHQSQPVDRVIYLINPILRGWVNYFRVVNSAKCFCYIKDWVEKNIRRHLMHARKRFGFGCNLIKV